MENKIIEKLIDKGFDASEIHNFCKDRDILTNITYTFAFTPQSEKEKHLQRIKDAEIEIDFTNFKK